MMLDNLRAMGVFACVVECNSFSGAAKKLGITTSAVSQQIRALEQELNVTLLHRSTRKISLTEAGMAFFQSCQDMLAAAERGKIRISELQDHLVGDLRIATTPELSALHVVPALSSWFLAHHNLNIFIDAANQYVDLMEHHIDIAVRMSPHIEQRDDHDVIVLARVEQVLVSTPSYMSQFAPIEHPQDLAQHHLLAVNTMRDFDQLEMTHRQGDEQLSLKMNHRISTNNVFVLKSLCQHGQGIARILYPDVQKELRQGELVEILPQWKMPEFVLYAVLLKREQQPVKITRCLEVLRNYFAQLPGGR